jgi:uncharacterized protein
MREGEACRIPTDVPGDEAGAVNRSLGARRIAVVGASSNPSRAGHYVPAYLQQAGHEIMPVNPNEREVLGVKCVPKLSDIQGPVDLVLVFRRPEYCPGVAEEAAAMRAKGIWLQSGIRSDEARRIAVEAGMDFVEDRCMMVERMRRA